jgi:hypothetical protein
VRAGIVAEDFGGDAGRFTAAPAEQPFGWHDGRCHVDQYSDNWSGMQVENSLSRRLNNGSRLSPGRGSLVVLRVLIVWRTVVLNLFFQVVVAGLALARNTLSEQGWDSTHCSEMSDIAGSERVTRRSSLLIYSEGSAFP